MDQIQRPGEELDHAAFARVWRRVMPEDRPDCPFTLEPSAPPALSTPTSPAAAAAAPAVPCACLGEGSARDLPELERMLRQTTDDFRIYRALARRDREGFFPPWPWKRSGRSGVYPLRPSSFRESSTRRRPPRRPEPLRFRLPCGSAFRPNSGRGAHSWRLRKRRPIPVWRDSIAFWPRRIETTPGACGPGWSGSESLLQLPAKEAVPVAAGIENSAAPLGKPGCGLLLGIELDDLQPGRSHQS